MEKVKDFSELIDSAIDKVNAIFNEWQGEEIDTYRANTAFKQVLQQIEKERMEFNNEHFSLYDEEEKCYPSYYRDNSIFSRFYICNECGCVDIRKNMKFCPECGRKIDWDIQ